MPILLKLLFLVIILGSLFSWGMLLLWGSGVFDWLGSLSGSQQQRGVRKRAN